MEEAVELAVGSLIEKVPCRFCEIGSRLIDVRRSGREACH